MPRRSAREQGYEDERVGRVDKQRESAEYDYKVGVMERWEEERADFQAEMDAIHEGQFDYGSPSDSMSSASGADSGSITASPDDGFGRVLLIVFAVWFGGAAVLLGVLALLFL